MANIKQYMELSLQDTKIDHKDIGDSALKLSNLYSKWTCFLVKEMNILRKLKDQKYKKYSERYRFFRFDDVYEWQRTEIDSLIKGDNEYQEVNAEYENQQQIVELIENTMRSLNSLGFNIKSFIAWESFRQGG